MRYRTAGGKFFDPETMEAGIAGETGVAVLEDMVRQLDNMPQGAAGWGPIEVLNAWLAGDIAMDHLVERSGPLVRRVTARGGRRSHGLPQFADRWRRSPMRCSLRPIPSSRGLLARRRRDSRQSRPPTSSPRVNSGEVSLEPRDAPLRTCATVPHVALRIGGVQVALALRPPYLTTLQEGGGHGPSGPFGTSSTPFPRGAILTAGDPDRARGRRRRGGRCAARPRSVERSSPTADRAPERPARTPTHDCPPTGAPTRRVTALIAEHEGAGGGRSDRPDVREPPRKGRARPLLRHVKFAGLLLGRRSRSWLLVRPFPVIYTR